MKKLLVISTAPLINQSGYYSAYSPYVRELEIWSKYSDEMHFCCPIWTDDKGLLNERIKFKITEIIPLEEFSVNSYLSSLTAVKRTIDNFRIIVNASRDADHIHLRCPGNIGLIGCIAQIFFPKKMKSAKYAGNWDPSSKQPWSYKLQKWILSNTFLTKNMQVLVYGKWPNQSSNVKSFFTASYSETERVFPVTKKLNDVIKFIFVGALVDGKRPLYALKIVHELLQKSHDVLLDIYGEGPQRKLLEDFIIEHNLSSIVTLHGNQSKETLISAYKKSHFLLLPSKSEGWPKAVAEAMFFGCVPVSTKISCIPTMVNHGARGVILSLDLKDDVDALKKVIANTLHYNQMSNDALQWSQFYTLEKFESEIKDILGCSLD